MQNARFAFALAAMLSFAPSLHAAVLYGYGLNSEFTTINQSNGQSSRVSLNIAGYPVAPIDLAGDWRIGSERIWATTSGAQSSLYQMGLTSAGGATNVGAYNFGLPREMRTLAFDGVTGKLFGTATDTTNSAGPAILYEINPATAAVTLIGNVGLDNVQALGFDLQGNLFGVSHVSSQSRLIQVNTQTGAGTLLSNLSVFFPTDFAVRPEDGVMLLSRSANANGLSELYSLDTTTGATQLLTAISPPLAFMQGMAFSPEPSAATALAAVVVIALRRKRQWENLR